MFTPKEIKNSRATTYKIFTIAIFSELVRQHLVQEKREFFTNDWFLTTLSGVIGAVCFNLFTYKIANRIKDGKLFNSLVSGTENPEFYKICLTDAIKYTTMNVVKAIALYFLLNKKPSKILFGIMVGMIGTIGFELLFNQEIKKEEQELLEGTSFYENFLLYSRTIKATIKASFSSIGADIAEDGDIDTDKLIGFLIVTFALPFFFLVIEPRVMSDCL